MITGIVPSAAGPMLAKGCRRSLQGSTSSSISTRLRSDNDCAFYPVEPERGSQSSATPSTVLLLKSTSPLSADFKRIQCEISSVIAPWPLTQRSLGTQNSLTENSYRATLGTPCCARRCRLVPLFVRKNIHRLYFSTRLFIIG
jgi:hypothetical protein